MVGLLVLLGVLALAARTSIAAGAGRHTPPAPAAPARRRAKVLEPGKP